MNKKKSKLDQLVLEQQMKSLNMINIGQINPNINPNNLTLISAAFQSQLVKDNPFFTKLQKRNNELNTNIMNRNIRNCSNSNQKNKNHKIEDVNIKKISNVTKEKNSNSKIILPSILNNTIINKELSDYELYKQNKLFYKNLTLAQKIGLEKIKQTPLTKSDWEKLENKVEIEHDTSCSICLEKLSSSTTTLLSCSHVFHKNCLYSFEKMTSIKTCPLCRTKNYQQKKFFKDKEIYISHSIILIQSYIRGWLFRIAIYQKYFKDNMPDNKLLRKKYSQFKIRELLFSINSKLKKENERKERLIELLRKDVENQKKIGLQLDKFTNNENKEEKKDWSELIEKFEIKQSDKCSICICPFSNKNVYLLNCGHVYHENCLNSFEKYDTYYIKRCPTCRKNDYIKKIITLK